MRGPSAVRWPQTQHPQTDYQSKQLVAEDLHTEHHPFRAFPVLTGGLVLTCNQSTCGAAQHSGSYSVAARLR